MKAFIIAATLFLTFSSGVFGQNISFTYDRDGNMESRYEAPLRSSSSEQEKDEESSKEILSVELGEHKITVHPNPTRGEICVEISSLNKGEKNFLLLYDMSGRQLKRMNILSERTYLEISGSAGAYLLNIHLGDNTSKWKIIKQ